MAARNGEGDMPELPYLLSDMAADGMALLTALGIGRAHIAGASMGGMIVQTMAIEHPHRVLSLTSVMSNTGESSRHAHLAVGRRAHRGTGTRRQPVRAQRHGSRPSDSAVAGHH
jgi:pimeloyl-ACP methyl ester carboxylesterase